MSADLRKVSLFVAQLGHQGFERHAAFGAIARMVLPDLRVHRAGIDRAGGLRGNVCVNARAVAVHITGRLGGKPGLALGAAEVVRPVFMQGVMLGLRGHGHAAHREIVGLILRHYQTVNDALNDRTYEPLILQRKHKRRTVPIIDEWCMGYYIGIAADLAAWQPLLDAMPELFKIIRLYGTEDGWESLEKKPLSDKRHDAAAESLADSA